VAELSAMDRALSEAFMTALKDVGINMVAQVSSRTESGAWLVEITAWTDPRAFPLLAPAVGVNLPKWEANLRG
jgi:hypothetical protein